MMEYNRSNDKGQKVVVTDGFSAEYLQDILKLERECFPAAWQYPEADEYYAAMLNDRENVNIFLRESGETVGYVLAKPFKNAVLDLKEYDPELTEESDKFYIETIQILPAYQGRGGARALLIGACEAVLKRGMNKFAIHARTVNGLHEIIKRIFKGSIILSRNIEKWKWAKDEPYEYIEWTYVPTEGTGTR
jgi:ribosomal protein S18 acetylase RimI-like enzyme